MTRNLRITVVLVALLMTGTASAQQTPDPRVADLVQAGKVRVGLFPPQYIKDAATGELKGVWGEIARALAARIGVQLVLLEHPTPPKVVECLERSACDLVFLPLDVRAADAGEFSSPFLQFDYTLLVPAGSSIRTVGDWKGAALHISEKRPEGQDAAVIIEAPDGRIVGASQPLGG